MSTAPSSESSYKPIGLRGLNPSIATFLVLLFSALWLRLRLPDPASVLSDFDGGTQLAGANQILFGEHPFIDFRSTYGPLTFYASALAQLITGGRVIGELALRSIGYVTAYGVLFRLIFVASKRVSIALLLSIVAIVLMPVTYKYYIVLGPLLCLLGISRYAERPAVTALFYIALAVVATGLYRPDFGFYSGLSVVAAIAFRPGEPFKIRLQRLGLFAGLVLICASPWLIWLVMNGALREYLYDSVVGAMNHAVGMSLPFPRFQLHPFVSASNGILASYVFYFSVPALSALALIAYRDRMTSTEREVTLATMVLAQASLFQASHRSDFGHLLQAIPIGFVLLGWIAGLAASRLSSVVHRERWGAALSLLVLTAFLMMQVILARSLGGWPRAGLSIVRGDLGVYNEAPEGVLEYVEKSNPASEVAQAMRYIRECTLPGERIMALPGSTNFYYMTGRPFGGGQLGIAPGYFSTDDDQRRMVQRMGSENIAMVVIWTGFAWSASKESQPENFAPLVYRYVAEHFEDAKSFGHFVVKVPRDRTRRSYADVSRCSPDDRETGAL